MSRCGDYQARAVKCRQLAEAAQDSVTRKVWADMELYWLRCGQGAETPLEIQRPAPKPDRIEI
jgi:hypothetical protein